jgi:hypothetical protein
VGFWAAGGPFVANVGAEVLVCREDWSATKDDFAMTDRPNPVLTVAILDGWVPRGRAGLSFASEAT